MQPQAGAIVGIGELLWDLLPAGRQLGGAPFNFIFRCHQLGHAAVVVSRVGRDELGREIREAFLRHDLNDAFLQEDFDRPTGTVPITLDNSGQPEFTITEDVAFDHIKQEQSWDALFGQAIAVCFGTLAQRDLDSQSAIRHALTLAQNALIICDINLRQPFYNRTIVETSLRACRWLKLNEDELTILCQLLQLRGKTSSVTLRDIRRRFEIELICMTRGARGCLVQTDDEEIVVPGRPVKVIDTVGAGDAFTAGLLVATLEGRTLGEAAVFANRLASHVAASAGGAPVIDRKELEG